MGAKLTNNLINSLKSRPQNVTPIASDMFLPNHSGLESAQKLRPETVTATHIDVYGTNTGANVDRYQSWYQGGIEEMYYGNYFGFTGLVQPNLTGALFFGIGNDSLTINAYLLLSGTTVNLVCNTTMAITAGTSLTLTSTSLGFYGTLATDQYQPNGASGWISVGGNAVMDGDQFDGDQGGSKYTIGDMVACLKLVGLLAP